MLLNQSQAFLFQIIILMYLFVFEEMTAILKKILYKIKILVYVGVMEV